MQRSGMHFKDAAQFVSGSVSRGGQICTREQQDISKTTEITFFSQMMIVTGMKIVIKILRPCGKYISDNENIIELWESVSVKLAHQFHLGLFWGSRSIGECSATYGDLL